MDPIFVKADEGYRSYQDFWRLVELSGYPIVSPREVDLTSPVTYIWAEANAAFIWTLSDHSKSKRRARVILWCLERPDSRAANLKESEGYWKMGLDEIFALVDELWVSDKTLHAFDTRARYVPCGGHSGLREAPSVRRVYDVAHLGQRTPRREAVIVELERRGLSVSPNAWGEGRAAILTSARALLGVDRLEGMRVAAPLRWALGAAYELPIVQEELPDPAPLERGRSIVMAPIESIADTVDEVLANGSRNVGRAAWETICRDRTFRKEVDAACG